MVPRQPISMFGGEEGLATNFQVLILSPNLLKTKFPNVCWGEGGGGGGGWWPTFCPESKSTKNQIALCPLGEGVAD